MRRPLVLAAIFASTALAPTTGFAVLLQIQNAFPNLPAFNWPVDIQAAWDGTDRLFVVEKDGRIWVFDSDPGVSTRTLFLDLTGQVRTNGSEGLLALAFHPDYETNGTFFVMYNTITPYTSRWARFQVSGDPDVADEASEVPLIEIPQTNTCHKGCGLVFGNDGYLYTSIGDDCQGWPGQDMTTLMGKLLRIDVDGTSPGLEYAIPPDNPFVGNQQGWREEIYASGFRNPWRFSIDHQTDRIFVGDVGEATWEEIDIVTKGRNYGWDVMEGFVCYPNPGACDTVGTNAAPPIWVYPHVSELGAAVVGGYVYRGPTLPRLWSKYIYADVGEGVFALSHDGSTWTNELIYTIDPSKQFVTFGVDEDNELYIASLFGQIYTFIDTGTDVGASPPAAPALTAYPNPFTMATRLRFDAPGGASRRVEIYDVRGRRVRHLTPRANAAEVRWRGRDDTGQSLSSGVYFARLIVDERPVAATRIVLVR